MADDPLASPAGEKAPKAPGTWSGAEAAHVTGPIVVVPALAPDFPIRGLRDEPQFDTTQSGTTQWIPGRAQTVAAVRERLSAPPPGVRRARLYVSRVDPWTVMKTSFMLSISLAFILVITTAILWLVLDFTGVFAALSQTINQVAGSATSTFNLMAIISFPKVVGASVVVSGIEIVLLSALATLFAFLYNLTVGISGGLEVTLSEDG
ncbi:MAG: DUF3566 domain-containing protein [Actinomycetes bacterium]